MEGLRDITDMGMISVGLLPFLCFVAVSFAMGFAVGEHKKRGTNETARDS